MSQEQETKKTYNSSIKAAMRYQSKFYMARVRLPLEWEEILKQAASDENVSLNTLISNVIEREIIKKRS